MMDNGAQADFYKFDSQSCIAREASSRGWAGVPLMVNGNIPPPKNMGYFFWTSD
jgi:hypothetical protein